jgi:hypothetical protein
MYFTDELISAIKKDISDAQEALDKPEFQKIKSDNFFSSSSQATCCSASL